MPLPEDTETFAPHQVPQLTDEQTFRAEVLRTLREMSRAIGHITERLHSGDLRLAEHAQRLQQQDATHRAEIERVKIIQEGQAQRIDKLAEKLQEEKDRNLELRTRFMVVWVALGALSLLGIGTLWALLVKGHP